MTTLSETLRHAYALVLTAKLPMCLAYGPGRLQLYNDAYARLLGARHPAALGQPFDRCWAAEWPLLGPRFDRAWVGEASLLEETPITIEETGRRRETFWTMSFSPVPEPDGSVGGVLHVAVDVTGRVLAARRLAVNTDLARRTIGSRSPEEACRRAAVALGAHALDLPFVLLYLLSRPTSELGSPQPTAGLEPPQPTAGLDVSQPSAWPETAGRLWLAGAVGLTPGTPAAPLRIGDAGPWPADDVLRSGVGKVVRCPPWPAGGAPGPWPEPPVEAVIEPLAHPAVRQPVGVLMAGLSPRQPFDAAYRELVASVAADVAAAVLAASA